MGKFFDQIIFRTKLVYKIVFKRSINTVPRLVMFSIKKKILRMKVVSRVGIGLTYRCQFKCTYCYSGRYKEKGELSFEEWKKIINQISKMGVTRVLLLGGEPTTRKDLFQLIKYMRKKRLIVDLETNGYLLDENFVKKLRNSGVSVVCIAMNGLSEEDYMKECHSKGYDRFKFAVRNCVKFKVPVVVSIVSSKERFPVLKRMIKVAKELGADGIRIVPPVPSGRCLGDDGFGLTEFEKKKLDNIIDHKICFRTAESIVHRTCCVLDKSLFYISPEGYIQPCAHMPLHFGKVNDNIKNRVKKMYENGIFKGYKCSCLMENMSFQRRNFSDVNKNEKLPRQLI